MPSPFWASRSIDFSDRICPPERHQGYNPSMKPDKTTPTLERPLHAPWQRLQWKLTLSYTLVTVGALLSVELVVLAISASSYLLQREMLPRNLVAELGSNIAPRIRPYLETDPPDLVGLQHWFDANQTVSLPRGGSSPNQVTLGGAGNAQLVVVGPDATFRAASGGTPFISGTVGMPLETSSLPALEVPLQAALAGKTDDRDLSARSGDDLVVAAPVRSADRQRVVGALLLIARSPAPPLLAVDVVGPVVAVLAGSTVVLLILAGSVGTVFGFITARGLAGRLARLANATNSWSQGDFSAVVADTSHDELGQLARRLNRMAEQLQNMLETRRELAVVEERNRLARDLHDSAKQQAFAASAQIGAARALIARDPDSADRHVAEAERLINALRKELSTLILELRPAALGDQGLATALQAYAADWSRQTGIAAAVRAQNERSLPLEIEQALFRIAQEALANTARHSGAQHADLWLGYESTRITLKIADDGRGFDTAAALDGFGLHSMQDRAEAIGARMSIESRPAEGTCITITCPIQDGTERP